MSSDPALPREDERPQPLSARETGRSAPARHEGLPPHLEHPVRDWVRGYFDRDVEQRIALLLEVVLSPRGRLHRQGSPPENLVDHPDVDLLDVVDLALQIQGAITHRPENPDDAMPRPGLHAFAVRPVSTVPLQQLDRLLDDGGSVYRVERTTMPPRLVRRVDPTVHAALDDTVANADPTAGSLLRDAWFAAYSRTPDPTTSYLDAVRAVETVARPLVLPQEPGATLGKVNAHLRQAGHQWELVLLDKTGDGSVGPLLGMLERLWEGQVSRRGGGPRSRDQTLDEARAAITLAVTCVQWLTAGYLQRRARDTSAP